MSGEVSEPLGDKSDLQTRLETLDPKARDNLRRVLIRDQADRDWIASPDPRRREPLMDHQATVSAAPSTLHRVGWSKVSCLPIKGLRLARPHSRPNLYRDRSGARKVWRRDGESPRNYDGTGET
jgi:hypothetical protein